MFYCSLHNWYSSEEPCRACYKTYTTITTTTTSPIPDTPEQDKEGVWSDEDLKEFRIFCSKFSVSYEDAISAFKKYKNGENFLWQASKQSQSNTPKEEQPIKEKDWEIVAYKHGGLIYKKDGDSFVSQDVFKYYITDEYLLLKRGEIHSVRRLSNGEVFSVGDEITFNDEAHKMKITCFNYLNGCMLVGFGNDSTITPVFLDNAKKLPSTKPEQPTKERIKVDVFPTNGTDCRNGMLMYRYATSSKVPNEKFPLIKNQIEAVLNDDTDLLTWAKYISPKEHQQKLDKAIEDAFYSRCETLEDYLSSFKKQ